MAATLKDISSQSGVGITTVSKVLNGKAVRCSEDVRQRILDTADRLNYRPNPLARSLVTGRSNNILLILPGLGLDFTATEQECYNNGYTLSTVSSHHSKKRIEDMIICARQSYVDGVMLMTPQLESDVLIKANKDGYPIVLLEDDKNVYPELDMFGIDIDGSVRLGINHLYDIGHRKIAIFLPNADYSASYLRLNAWKSALAEKGITPNKEWLFWFEDVVNIGAKIDVKSGNYNAAMEFMNRFPKNSSSRPTALIVMVDTLALPVERAFISNGWRIPQDISIISTMSESIGQYAQVPVTSVNLDQGGARIRALRYLLQKISGELESDVPARNFALPRLVLRNSTASFGC